jgi:hypothetical protein
MPTQVEGFMEVSARLRDKKARSGIEATLCVTRELTGTGAAAEVMLSRN